MDLGIEKLRFGQLGRYRGYGNSSFCEKVKNVKKLKLLETCFLHVLEVPDHF